MPAGNTYVAIDTTTLGSAQASVTFSSIPSTYTDLVVVCSLRADTVTFNNMNYPDFSFNGDFSGTTYSFTSLYSRNTGSGDSANSTRGSNDTDINFGGVATTNMTSGIFSSYIVNVMNYANTTTYKTALGRIGTGGNTTAIDGVWATVGLWRNTAAITSIKIGATSGGNFVAGSTFSLYGIKSA